MFPHVLNKAHPTKDGRLIHTKAIHIKDSGIPVVLAEDKQRRDHDQRRLARLRLEARRLLGLA